MLKPLLIMLVMLMAADAIAAEHLQFNRDIRPILSDNCFFCHGPDKNNRKAELRLDVRKNALEQKAFAPGKPDQSALVERILSDDADLLMPPPDSHKKLTPRQKEILKSWIADGAEYQLHWAFLPPVKLEPPRIQKQTAEILNPIDAFIPSRLDQEGLMP